MQDKDSDPIDDASADYEVGYAKPPRHHQFKPGQSGNPHGRPKRATNLRTDLREELSEQVVITENGRPRRITKRRLILKALATKAAKGDVRAAERIVSLVIQIEGIPDERPASDRLSQHDQAILHHALGGSAAPVGTETTADPATHEHRS